MSVTLQHGVLLRGQLGAGGAEGTGGESTAPCMCECVCVSEFALLTFPLNFTGEEVSPYCLCEFVVEVCLSGL